MAFRKFHGLKAVLESNKIGLKEVAAGEQISAV